MHRVLVVDDDKVLQDSVKKALEFHHFFVDVADNGKEALNAVTRQKYDLVVMDVNMPEMDGIEALTHIKKYDPSIIVLILTAYSNVSDAVKVVKEGAYNYLEKPISSENLVALIKRALKARSLVETSLFSAPTLSLGKSEDKFVGESDVMKKVFNVISKLAQVNTPVLIRGESGTGKELVAKAIHFNGPRKDEKFVTINLAAIPDNLIESELFGHEKGAFTGASERKIGKFQYADGGTLFLDEIGDVSPTMQVKLLRVLQERIFTPVGSNRDIKVDVRIIAASHKPFEEMIKDGRFREDLFYRLNVLPVYLPPLRERQADIGHLVDYYVKYFNGIHGLNIKGPTDDALAQLKGYAWPGNIRELRNVIEHAFIIESSEQIHLTSLPEVVRKGSSAQTHDEEDEESPIDFKGIKDSVLDQERTEEETSAYKFTFATVDENDDVSMDFQAAKDKFEKEFILHALKFNKGKINQTALKANIPKKTLLRKIEKYEINPKEFY
ncbi:MAG: two-component system response regulator [Bdellovibrionales bacterium CG12_big_fil_rev_8_21_14_0_65_38_15]|nr:MAG: two-component system response regulator [Bdellovibrionales bacterium CG22_combo_CG10-13_8_21_14_all_38_13]PIQ55899.1 MAG: two-component system response regulator [Bdellovibrionales bacterium CG12_big_fil_rev_8_21_14_0_65_38_15]PIR29650.1 MAG: two-component system response regulator [Bdellovibrionales bacterium CG11_big_fil_rev_8_21_14_0_20_38_13]